MDDDDSDLVRRILAGDPAAGLLLISRLTGPLTRYARFYAPDLGDLEREDAVDTALVKVVDKIESFDPARSSLATWARAFVRYAILDLRRSPRLETATDPNELPVASPMNAGWNPELPPSPESVALTALLMTVVSEEDAALVMARGQEGLPFEAIAASLNPSPTAAALRQRYHRAVKRLRAAAANDRDLQKFIEEATT